MSFDKDWQQQSWHDWQLQSRNFTLEQVHSALAKPRLALSDLQALLSPAALPLLPVLAAKAQQLTRQRFGHNVQFYAPLYLSNLCANECTYCGFSLSQKVKRRTLNLAEIEQECRAIKALGIDQVLLVTGEHERKVGIDYFCFVLPLVRRYFSSVQLEVQPLSSAEYNKLKALGVDAVMLYQETYNAAAYQQYHLKGKKSDIRWRLDAPDRVGQAGIDKIGLGILLGLSDWRTDAILLAHAFVKMVAAETASKLAAETLHAEGAKLPAGNRLWLRFDARYNCEPYSPAFVASGFCVQSPR